jgi:retron-type reverse transcriptase
VTPDFDVLLAWDNLLQAYRRAARGKRGRANVAAFEFRLEDNLVALRHELQAGSYRPGGYRNFTIHEPKRRLISAAHFRDRVVHHALCQVIEPVFERAFLPNSYANRVGRGTHRALDAAQHLARRHRLVLQCDVRQFFPSLDHATLRAAIERKVADPRILWLVETILDAGARVLDEEYDMVYFPGDDLFAVERARGLPIGNLTSQFWANVYLNEIDHFVTRELRCRGYVRYVDDLLLFGDDADGMRGWRERLAERLGRLRLTLHPGADPRPVSEGFPFLGFVVAPFRRRLKHRKVVQARRRIARLSRQWNEGLISSDHVTASVRGWINHARYGNTVGLRKAVLAPLVLRPRPADGTRGVSR